MKLLRQSTQTVIDIGPILGTDFLTVQTGLSLSASHAELYKAGATALTDISGNTWAHISGGVYRLTLTAGDLSALGPLLINIHIASSQPLAISGNVLQATAYDALCGGGNIYASLRDVYGSADAANNLSKSALGIVPIIVGTGSTTTVIPTDLTSAVSTFYAGRTLVFITGALAGQAAAITGYNGSTKALTVTALTSAPAIADTAVIV